MTRIGSYELLSELASGGMGVVYLARKLGDAGFERIVVLKRIHRHRLADPVLHATLRDEARVASLLRHPNLVPVTDVVELEGEISLVLDYVESVSLAELMGARLPTPILARIMVDALTGLHAAHEAVDLDGRRLDLVHRDVSPQNILVGVDGVSRIIDFGIAKITARLAETTAGELKGKLRYMAPEQARRGPIDRRADVYAAGVVLYEAVTGRPIFQAEDPGDLLLNVLLGDVEVPSMVVPDVPKPFEAVVLRALASDRDDRFATAEELVAAIEQAVTVAPARDVARFVEAHGGAALEERRARLRNLRRPAPRRRSRWAHAVLAFVALALGTLAMQASGFGLQASGSSPKNALAEQPAHVPSAPVASAEPLATTPSVVVPTPPPPPAVRPRARPPAPRPTSPLHPNPYGRHP